MQRIYLGLFTIICGYSLVISLPIDENLKKTAASDAANHLLKELAKEQHTNETINKDEEDNNTQYLIEIDDLYPLINEESSSETDDSYDDLFSSNEEEEFNEDYAPVIHTPIIDDTLMKAEDH